MQRRVRRFLTAIREHSSVSYAKIATMSGFCDVDLITIKATAPNDLPLPEKYIHELLKIFSLSPSSLQAFSLSFTRRFGKTRCWRVALECLLLLHRLLRSVPDDSPFRSELLWTRSNGLLTLHPCQFTDDSSSSAASGDYTAFIRSYAQLLDEALNCFVLDTKLGQESCEEEDQLPRSTTLRDKMKEVGRMLEVLPQLQSLIDCVMDCRPTGLAERSFIVRSTMKHVIRDSFMCYTMFRKEIVVVLDNLLQMPYGSCISAFGVYKKAAVQASLLSEFYEWCKGMGLCGSYEYPFVDRIPNIQIRALETFLSGMWQMGPSSSSPAASRSRSPSSESTLMVDDDGERQLVPMDMGNSEGAALVRPCDEMEPLIKFEDDENVGCWDDWEALLEASVSLPPFPPSGNFSERENRLHVDCSRNNGQGDETNA
ncbi:probable clathrin assembly protein At4g32285 [Corylus avellana]|uniref:probable clathrin assembly protein At4g32285 n=1 Tax=Corylus avellana TaxID=13451 RepID=UPI001E23C844|nr:probable clathrin assembly protein At4g32285 [Corylus avellana]